MLKNKNFNRVLIKSLYEKAPNKINSKTPSFCKLTMKFFCEINNKNISTGKFSFKNMKKQIKDYGTLGITIYLCLYVPSLLTFYYLFKSKTLDPAKVIDVLSRAGAESFLDVEYMKKLSHSEGATVAFALICNRLSLVIRLPLTLYLTILFKKILKK